MKKQIKIILLTILLSFIFSSNANSSGFENRIIWTKYPSLPSLQNGKSQMGFAAGFSGNSNGVLIYAGGCNFPQNSVNEGGKKKFYDDIYVYQPGAKSWLTGYKMHNKIAYGISITTADGLICIGGENVDGDLSSVFLLKWNSDAKTIESEEYPNLPFTLREGGGCIVDNKIYVLAGVIDGQLQNKLVCLDLSKKGTEDFKWNILSDFPGSSRQQPVVVAQNAAERKYIYLFSGSSFPTNDSIPHVNTDILKYDISKDKWYNEGEINIDGIGRISLHGGVGMAVGSQYIMLTGGVNYDIFKNALETIRRGEALTGSAYDKFLDWKQTYMNHPIDWYKFNNRIIVYNTITKSWAMLSDSPFTGRTGAGIASWEDGWVIISGEIKPGTRTPEVYYAKLIAEPQFGWANWTVLIAYLLGMIFLGYYFMKKEQSADNFFKGGGKIPWWAAGMSIFATMLSAITFMAIPAKVYATDWRYFPMAITILLMSFPVVKYYLPFFRRLNVTTAYEYLEIRFNYTIRFLASFLFIIFMVARMALVLFLPSLALTAVTGIDIYICIILMGVITIIYCTMGGVEAVIWGDVIQGFVLIGGALFAILFLILGTDGGLNGMLSIAIDNDKFKMFDWSFDWSNATIWVIILGGLANNLISYSSDQTVIQRYLTTNDEKSAGKSIVMNGILSIIVSAIFYFIGTGLYSYYTTNPAQMNLSSHNPDSIFPHFIMSEMPIGLAGLLIAAIFAATMSTISSNVNSISTAFTSDFYIKLKPKSSDKHRLNVARISGIVFGGIGVGLALLMATWNILSLFDYFNYILGLLTSAIGGLFLMGIFFPRINGVGAIIGFISSTIILLLIKSHTDISFWLFGFIGMSLSVIIALIFSYIIRSNKKDLRGLTWKTLKK